MCGYCVVDIREAPLRINKEIADGPSPLQALLVDLGASRLCLPCQNSRREMHALNVGCFATHFHHIRVSVYMPNFRVMQFLMLKTCPQKCDDCTAPIEDNVCHGGHGVHVVKGYQEILKTGCSQECQLTSRKRCFHVRPSASPSPQGVLHV